MILNGRVYTQKMIRQIITMRDNDLKLRDRLLQLNALNDGYNLKMEALHIANSKHLETFIRTIGFPSIPRVGVEAAFAAHLIIQHSISRPDFMKYCVKILELEMLDADYLKRFHASLTDRIAYFEGRDQLYGTQFDWDEEGQLSPLKYDDINLVNERRKKIGLNTLEERIQEIREEAAQENSKSPSNPEQKAKQFNRWRKRVGWI